MPRPLGIDEFFLAQGPIVDVRSPGEFGRGHIPGAVNVPLFSDAERAVVGTLYKQAGRNEAVLEGLRIVGPKLASFVEQTRALARDGRIRVHCWRGGERSGSMAWLLERAGFEQVSVLQGGYKAFRTLVIASFTRPLGLRVLGGYTGTGKTETLQYLRDLGEQVMDLEAMACHMGSSFGALGQLPQPGTEHFENMLWNAIRSLDLHRYVWVEDESHMIGQVKIPDALFAQLRSARLFFANMSVEERAARLVVDYGGYPRDKLAEAIKRIERRLGPQHCKAALEALATDDLRTVALIMLRYYDKAYGYGISTRDPRSVVELPARADDLRGLAQQLITHARDRTN